MNIVISATPQIVTSATLHVAASPDGLFPKKKARRKLSQVSKANHQDLRS